MKKLFRNLFALSAAASLVFLLSCNDDGEDPTFDAPTITITSTDFVDGVASGAPGDEISIEAEVDAPGVFDHLDVTIYIDDQNAWDTTATRTPGETPTSFTFGPIGLTLESAWIGKTVEVELQAGDDNSQMSELVTLTIEVTSPEARVYSAFLLAAPLAEDPETEGDQRNSLTWFSTNLGERITSANIVAGTSSSADVDFGYYYLQADGLSLAAPSDFPSEVYDLGSNGQNWGTLNETTLKSTTLNASAFAEVVTFADIDAAFDEGTESAGVKKQLAVGDVLAFETDADKEGGSKRGLILVTELVDANENGVYWDENDGIQIEVIVQESAE